MLNQFTATPNTCSVHAIRSYSTKQIMSRNIDSSECVLMMQWTQPDMTHEWNIHLSLEFSGLENIEWNILEPFNAETEIEQCNIKWPVWVFILFHTVLPRRNICHRQGNNPVRLLTQYGQRTLKTGTKEEKGSKKERRRTNQTNWSTYYFAALFTAWLEIWVTNVVLPVKGTYMKRKKKKNKPLGLNRGFFIPNCL